MWLRWKVSMDAHSALGVVHFYNNYTGTSFAYGSLPPFCACGVLPQFLPLNVRSSVIPPQCLLQSAVTTWFSVAHNNCPCTFSPATCSYEGQSSVCCSRLLQLAVSFVLINTVAAGGRLTATLGLGASLRDVRLSKSAPTYSLAENHRREDHGAVSTTYDRTCYFGDLLEGKHKQLTAPKCRNPEIPQKNA